MPRLDADALRPRDLDTWSVLVRRAIDWLGALLVVSAVGMLAALFTHTDLTPLWDWLGRATDLLARALAIPAVAAVFAIVREGLLGRRQSANTEYATRKELPEHLARIEELVRDQQSPPPAVGITAEQAEALLAATRRSEASASRVAARLDDLARQVEDEEARHERGRRAALATAAHDALHADPAPAAHPTVDPEPSATLLPRRYPGSPEATWPTPDGLPPRVPFDLAPLPGSEREAILHPPSWPPISTVPRAPVTNPASTSALGITDALRRVDQPAPEAARPMPSWDELVRGDGDPAPDRRRDRAARLPETPQE